MKHYLIGLVVIGLMLSSCGRSPDSKFYVLNPIPSKQKKVKTYTHLKIGINDINGPAYMKKPQLTIFHSAQQVKLEEYHRWVENLGQNAQNVIKSNLSLLLPGAAFVSAPWDVNYKPKYLLQIDFLQFDVDVQGDSKLRAEYLVYSNKSLIKKGIFSYNRKATPPTVPNLVASMNMNLNQFTRDLAKVLASL